jgi:hypothetical protein
MMWKSFAASRGRADGWEPCILHSGRWRERRLGSRRFGRVAGIGRRKADRLLRHQCWSNQQLMGSFSSTRRQAGSSSRFMVRLCHANSICAPVGRGDRWTSSVRLLEGAAHRVHCGRYPCCHFCPPSANTITIVRQLRTRRRSERGFRQRFTIFAVRSPASVSALGKYDHHCRVNVNTASS